jgi:hypothetical protein
VARERLALDLDLDLDVDRRASCVRAFEEVDDGLVLDLGEVVVPLADRSQPRRLPDTHDLVGVAGQRCYRVRRRDGYRQHDPGGPVGPCDLAGGPRRRAGRDAIVDDHRHSVDEVDPRRCRAEPVCSPLELFALALLDAGEIGVGGIDETHDLVVDHANAVLADRPHCEFGLVGAPDLADDDDVQWSAERLTDLEGDRHATARQAEDDDVVVAQMRQLRSKLASTVRSIVKSRCQGTPPRARCSSSDSCDDPC